MSCLIFHGTSRAWQLPRPPSPRAAPAPTPPCRFMTTRQRWSALLGLFCNKKTKWTVCFCPQNVQIINTSLSTFLLFHEYLSAAAMTDCDVIRSYIKFHLRANLLKSHLVRTMSCPPGHRADQATIQQGVLSQSFGGAARGSF